MLGHQLIPLLPASILERPECFGFTWTEVRLRDQVVCFGEPLCRAMSGLADLGALPRVRILGASLFCWSSICVTSLVCYTVFPDRSVLPNMILAMGVGSILMGVIIRVLLSDRWQRASEHVQEHIWASMHVGKMEGGAQPKFHRIQMRTSQTPKGTKSVTTVLEAIDVLWQSPGKQHTCVCCLEDFKAEDLVTLLPCGHFFHESCHADWLNLKRSANACPICRDSWANV